MARTRSLPIQSSQAPPNWVGSSEEDPARSVDWSRKTEKRIRGILLFFFVFIYYHGVEVGESADEGGELGEALLEGVAEVVRRVGGDN